MIRAGALLLALGAAADAPTTLFTVPAEHRLVEGIAIDGDFVWVSSVLDRTILADTQGMMGAYAMPKGTLHPMGLAFDAKRNWLWIASDCPELPGIARCESGALVAIDRRGRLKAKRVPAKGFHPGDVSVGGSSVFVSDTLNGAVYRLLPDGRSFRTLIAPGVGRSAQGTALTPDGKRLIVADYGRGIASVDLETGVRTLLPMPDGTPLRGIDGLVRVGDRYFTLYNASNPAALIGFRVTATGIETEVVHRGAPLTDPTQLATDGKRLLVVADAGWPAATKGDGAPREGTPIVAFDIPKPCQLRVILKALNPCRTRFTVLEAPQDSASARRHFGRPNRISADPAVPRRGTGAFERLRVPADAGRAPHRHPPADAGEAHRI